MGPKTALPFLGFGGKQFQRPSFEWFGHYPNMTHWVLGSQVAGFIGLKTHRKQLMRSRQSSADYLDSMGLVSCGDVAIFQPLG